MFSEVEVLLKSLESAFQSWVTRFAVFVILAVFLWTILVVIRARRLRKQLSDAVDDYCAAPEAYLARATYTTNAKIAYSCLEAFNRGTKGNSRTIHTDDDRLDAEDLLGRVRLLASFSQVSLVPGILTAIGLLGTFFGISSALGTLKVSNAPSETVLNGVVIGLASAFWTSIVGVGFGVVAGVFGRNAESNMENVVLECNDKLARKFRIHIPESDTDNVIQELRTLQTHVRDVPMELKNHFNSITRDIFEPILRETKELGIKAAEAYCNSFVVKVTDDVARTIAVAEEAMAQRMATFASSVLGAGESVVAGLNSNAKVLLAMHKVMDILKERVEQVGSVLTTSVEDVKSMAADTRATAERLSQAVTDVEQHTTLEREHQSRMMIVYQGLLDASEAVGKSVTAVVDLERRVDEHSARALNTVEKLAGTVRTMKTFAEVAGAAVKEQAEATKVGQKLIEQSVKLTKIVDDRISKIQDNSNEFVAATTKLGEVLGAVTTLAHMPAGFRQLSTDVREASQEITKGVEVQHAASRELTNSLRNNAELLEQTRKTLMILIGELTRELDQA